MSSEPVLMLEGDLFEKGRCLEARVLFGAEGIAIHGFDPIEMQENEARKAADPGFADGLPRVAAISWSSVSFIELPRETSDLTEVIRIVETSGKMHPFRPVSSPENDTVEDRDRRLARLEMSFGSVAKFRRARRSLWQRCWPMVPVVILPIGLWLVGNSLAQAVEDRAGDLGRGGIVVALFGSIGVLWLFHILAACAALLFATIQFLMFRDRS